MNNLPTIIGLAPSELTFEQFRSKLQDERERIRRGLEYFRTVRMRPKGQKTSAVGISKLMKEAGLSHAQLLKGIELLKQQKEKKD